MNEQRIRKSRAVLYAIGGHGMLLFLLFHFSYKPTNGPNIDGLPIDWINATWVNAPPSPLRNDPPVSHVIVNSLSAAKSSILDQPAISDSARLPIDSTPALAAGKMGAE
ncbi:MAG: hypothetical protein JSR26_01155 [Proteobacteria bacterium]|nr:hypothetical protein [Pseudomonadota bacterium]